MENLTITLKERKEMPFVEYGDKIKVKTVDFSKAIAALVKERKDKGMSMIVVLKACKIEKHKELRVTLSWTRDPETDIYYGLPFGIHLDGNVKWQKIPLMEHNTFNLERPDEAKKWIVLRMHPSVKDSPLQLAEPLFEIYDPDQEAKLIADRAGLVAKAIGLAQKMKTDDILGFHRYLGLPLPGELTKKIVRSDLLRAATEDPFSFMDKYNHPMRKLNELYHSCKTFGIVEYDVDKGFTYQGQFLGLTDLDVIRYLEENSNVVSALRLRLEEADEDAKTLKKQ